VLGVTILPLPTILIFDFGTVLTVWYFFSISLAVYKNMMQCGRHKIGYDLYCL